MLNIGLLTPQGVVRRALEHAEAREVPLASLEGFLRQVIGWREFMRAAYDLHGVTLRTSNRWQHHRRMPRALYQGTTGLPPIDDTVRRVLATGYCHHIERLMVLGGFMFLLEIEPDDVYTWFMEMFVDSYDWVMVPNVYGMSQDSAGGLITSKPYFSGSNYLRKMSNYPVGAWCDVWDGLYWRFILKNREALAENPRWSLMVSQAKRLESARKERLLEAADGFLAELFGSS